jgi:hypothetical protein
MLRKSTCFTKPFYLLMYAKNRKKVPSYYARKVMLLVRVPLEDDDFVFPFLTMAKAVFTYCALCRSITVGRIDDARMKSLPRSLLLRFLLQVGEWDSFFLLLQHSYRLEDFCEDPGDKAKDRLREANRDDVRRGTSRHFVPWGELIVAGRFRRIPGETVGIKSLVDEQSHLDSLMQEWAEVVVEFDACLSR